jgi:hypothetical protein
LFTFSYFSINGDLIDVFTSIFTSTLQSRISNTSCRVGIIIIFSFNKSFFERWPKLNISSFSTSLLWISWNFLNSGVVLKYVYASSKVISKIRGSPSLGFIGSSFSSREGIWPFYPPWITASSPSYVIHTSNSIALNLWSFAK